MAVTRKCLIKIHCSRASADLRRLNVINEAAMARQIREDRQDLAGAAAASERTPPLAAVRKQIGMTQDRSRLILRWWQ